MNLTIIQQMKEKYKHPNFKSKFSRPQKKCKIILENLTIFVAAGSGQKDSGIGQWQTLPFPAFGLLLT